MLGTNANEMQIGDCGGAGGEGVGVGVGVGLTLPQSGLSVKDDK